MGPRLWLLVCLAGQAGLSSGCAGPTPPAAINDDEALACGTVTLVPRTMAVPIDPALVVQATAGTPARAVPAAAFASSEPESADSDRPPRVVYLNPGHRLYEAGVDDSAQGASSVVSAEHLGSAMLPGFTGSAGAFSTVTSCIAAQFQRFNLRITDERPGSGPYIEAHFGGDGSELGLPLGTGGIAPIDRASCAVLDRAVVYIFTAIYGDNLQAICEAGAQEIAHAFSLDHEYLCQDPMSYVQGCGKKAFQDKDAPCGETEPRACICGRTTQNSVRLLAEKIGWAAPDRVPEAAAERPSNDDPVVVTVGTTELRISGLAPAYAADSAVTLGIEKMDGEPTRAPIVAWRSPTRGEQALSLCAEGPGRYSVSVQIGPAAGDRALIIRSDDGTGGDPASLASVPVVVPIHVQ
jgi:hypothetical protein